MAPNQTHRPSSPLLPLASLGPEREPRAPVSGWRALIGHTTNGQVITKITKATLAISLDHY